MKPILLGVSLGADPEVFIVDKNTGDIVPSLDLIGGSKWMPRETSKPGFFVQEDNVLGEYNIPPSKSVDEFKDNILLGMKLFEEFLPDNFTTLVKASHKFTPAQLEDPRASEFGCDRDRAAWNGGKFNKPPQIPVDGLRAAGGHIHIGYNEDKEALAELGVMLERRDINRQLVKWQDLYLGVPSMMMDTDRERKRLYGKAGAYRDKPYGVEYRTLSSFWLSSEERIKWAYNQTMRSVEQVSNMETVPDSAMERILAAINVDDKKAAESLIKEFDLQVV